jgi:transposase
MELRGTHIGKPKLSDAMMWRACPDHEENDVTGKRRLSGRLKNEVDFSAIRELAGADSE